MERSNEERKLLSKLHSGKLEGLIGDILTTSSGSNVWTEIIKGIPTRYKRGPGGKFFNGKENERYEGKKQIIREWDTDDEQLDFLKKFGFLLKDKDVQAYSSKHRTKK